MKRLLLPILLATVHAGCYRYAPASLDELATGAEVRVRLSAAEIDRIREHVSGDDRLLEGRFVSRTGERVLLDVPVTRVDRGIHLDVLHQRIDLSVADLVELEIRELDRLRTVLVTTAGLAVLAGVLLPRFVGGGDGGGGDGGDPGPEAPRVPGIAVPLPH